MTQNRRYMSVDEPEYDLEYDQLDNSQDEGVEQYDDAQAGADYLGVDDSPYSPSMSEAVRRIQVAKLYEALLSQHFFAVGSTRDPSIQDQVEGEIKEFIHRRLEELLGLRTVQAAAQPVQVQLPFDDEQVQALSYLADRALKRVPAATPQPVVNVAAPTVQEPIVQQAQVPQVNQLQVSAALAQPKPVQVAPRRTQPRQAAVPQQNQSQQARRQAKPRRRTSENVSEKTGKDLSQAVGKRVKPKPMPNQSTMDTLNAQAAEKNASGSPVLSEAAKAVQAGNGNISVGQVLAQVLSQANGGKQ